MQTGETTEENRSTDSSTSDQGRTSFDVFGTDQLYGRDEEKQQVIDAYNRVKENSPPRSELVLISGNTGTGKSALATVVRQRSQDDYGHFVTGKFHHLQRPEPHAALVEALNGFVACTVGRGEVDVRRTRKAIQKSIGEECKVLTDMAPDFKQILGETYDLPSLLGHSSETASRFKYVIRALLATIAEPDRPFVLLLEDLHWADEASLDLIATLLMDTDIRGILYIVTVRTGDEGDKKIQQILSQVRETEVNVTRIELHNLSKSTIAAMMADTLQGDPGPAELLADVVYGKTKGNCFFLREYLRVLRDRGMLRRDVHGWTVDDAHGLELEFEDMNELIRSEIDSLPTRVTNMLKIASCLGSNLDEDIFRHIMGEPVLPFFHVAAEKGLVSIDHWGSTYQFTHDAIQESAYNMIDPAERAAIHCDIGRRLWASFDGEMLNSFIFVVVGQFLIGDHQISNKQERQAIAQLFLRAGEKAARMSSFRTAFVYLLHGIELLGEDCWSESYSLSLDLYNAASELAYCNGAFEKVDELTGKVVRNAKTVEDTYRSQSTKVYALGSSGRMLEAIDIGLRVLKGLGVSFPRNPSVKDMSRDIQRTKKLLKGKTNEYIMRLPTMTDSTKLAAMQLLNLIYVSAHYAKPTLAPLVGSMSVRLSLEHGVCAASSLGFVVYAMCLCGFGNDIREGYRMGQLSISMYERFTAKAWLVRLTAGYYGCVHPWCRPIREVQEPLKNAYRIGLDSGDIEFAMINANLYCWSQLELISIHQLDGEILVFAEAMKRYGQAATLIMVKPMWQMLHNLMGTSAKVCKLEGDIIQPGELDEWKTLRPLNYAWSHFNSLMLCYLFADYNLAEQHAKDCQFFIECPFGSIDLCHVFFFEAMTALALASTSKARKQALLALVKKRVERIRRWAQHSPYNFLAKQYLIEAEIAVVEGDECEIHPKYVSAIALAKESGSIVMAALANERFGKYYLNRGQNKEAQEFINEAVRHYERWGATAKVAHLKAELCSVNFE